MFGRSGPLYNKVVVILKLFNGSLSLRLLGTVPFMLFVNDGKSR